MAPPFMLTPGKGGSSPPFCRSHSCCLLSLDVLIHEGLTILDTKYAVEDYAIAVAKGNTALLEAVNAAMAELKADGTFQAIVDKYIKAE